MEASTPAEVRQLWLPVRSALRRLGVPCEIEWHGGACIVIAVGGEDPNEWAWLGAAPRPPIGDGPWLPPTLDVQVVGGYRYRRSAAAAEHSTSGLVTQLVAHPGDEISVASALASTWRTLRSAPISDAGVDGPRPPQTGDPSRAL